MKLRDFKIDNNEKMTLMGGMNVLESRDLAMEVAEKFKNVTDKNDINYIFKGSFDKANRSSINSFRGPGLDEGLKILEEISNEMADQVTIAKHNIDNEPNTPTKFGIRGIPTMLLFKDGDLKATKVGATTKSNIVTWIKENM